MPTHRQPAGVVRREWLYTTTRECQVFFGTVLDNREELPAAVRRLIAALPQPANAVESLALHGLLLDMTLRWGEQDHRHFHRQQHRAPPCRFAPATIVTESWGKLHESPLIALSRWAVTYAEAFSAAHAGESVMRARRYVEEHFAHRLQISDLAERCHCTATALQRNFHVRTGLTMHQYQTQLRTRHAIELLRSTDLKLDAIAHHIGFAGKKDLYRILREAADTTPGAIRQQSSGSDR